MCEIFSSPLHTSPVSQNALLAIWEAQRCVTQMRERLVRLGQLYGFQSPLQLVPFLQRKSRIEELPEEKEAIFIPRIGLSSFLQTGPAELSVVPEKMFDLRVRICHANISA